VLGLKTLNRDGSFVSFPVSGAIVFQELSAFLDGAVDGFIYFSLGSNVRSDKLSAEKRQHFLDAFAALPQRVLWKWESDEMPGKPQNVMLGKWLPQTDILGGYWNKMCNHARSLTAVKFPDVKFYCYFQFQE
jgi:hypothetical protein